MHMGVFIPGRFSQSSELAEPARMSKGKWVSVCCLSNKIPSPPLPSLPYIQCALTLIVNPQIIKSTKNSPVGWWHLKTDNGSSDNRCIFLSMPFRAQCDWYSQLQVQHTPVAYHWYDQMVGLDSGNMHTCQLSHTHADTSFESFVSSKQGVRTPSLPRPCLSIRVFFSPPTSGDGGRWKWLCLPVHTLIILTMLRHTKKGHAH